jgi:hypothetical protein
VGARRGRQAATRIVLSSDSETPISPPPRRQNRSAPTIPARNELDASDDSETPIPPPPLRQQRRFVPAVPVRNELDAWSEEEDISPEDEFESENHYSWGYDRESDQEFVTDEEAGYYSADGDRYGDSDGDE